MEKKKKRRNLKSDFFGPNEATQWRCHKAGAPPPRRFTTTNDGKRRLPRFLFLFKFSLVFIHFDDPLFNYHRQRRRQRWWIQNDFGDEVKHHQTTIRFQATFIINMDALASVQAAPWYLTNNVDHACCSFCIWYGWFCRRRPAAHTYAAAQLLFFYPRVYYDSASKIPIQYECVDFPIFLERKTHWLTYFLHHTLLTWCWSASACCSREAETLCFLSPVGRAFTIFFIRRAQVRITNLGVRFSRRFLSFQYIRVYPFILYYICEASCMYCMCYHMPACIFIYLFVCILIYILYTWHTYIYIHVRRYHAWYLYVVCHV